MDILRSIQEIFDLEETPTIQFKPTKYEYGLILTYKELGFGTTASGVLRMGLHDSSQIRIGNDNCHELQKKVLDNTK